jgi:hypothetical protein
LAPKGIGSLRYGVHPANVGLKSYGQLARDGSMTIAAEDSLDALAHHRRRDGLRRGIRGPPPEPKFQSTRPSDDEVPTILAFSEALLPTPVLSFTRKEFEDYQQ